LNSLLLLLKHLHAVRRPTKIRRQQRRAVGLQATTWDIDLAKCNSSWLGASYTFANIISLLLVAPAGQIMESTDEGKRLL